MVSFRSRDEEDEIFDADSGKSIPLRGHHCSDLHVTNRQINPAFKDSSS